MGYGIHVPALQAHLHGAVTPVDTPSVQAAKVEHFAAKAAAYAANPIVAPLAIAAPAAHIAIAKREAEAEPAYGYRSYGYGRRYGGYRSYGYGKRSAEPGYGYRSYGYGRNYGYGYRSYGYGY